MLIQGNTKESVIYRTSSGSRQTKGEGIEMLFFLAVLIGIAVMVTYPILCIPIIAVLAIYALVKVKS